MILNTNEQLNLIRARLRNPSKVSTYLSLPMTATSETTSPKRTPRKNGLSRDLFSPKQLEDPRFILGSHLRPIEPLDPVMSDRFTPKSTQLETP